MARSGRLVSPAGTLTNSKPVHANRPAIAAGSRPGSSSLSGDGGAEKRDGSTKNAPTITNAQSGTSLTAENRSEVQAPGLRPARLAAARAAIMAAPTHTSWPDTRGRNTASWSVKPRATVAYDSTVEASAMKPTA